MPAPKTAPRGSAAPRNRVDGGVKKPKGNTRTKASQPGSDGKGNKKKKTNTTPLTIEALNPPFDPRMRRIGNPDNLTSRIKRGWVQDKEATKRVNFMFNPSDLSLQHAVDPAVPSTEQTEALPDQADTQINLPTTGSSTGIKLLYDRTYETFSPPKGGKLGFANRYGVWADVAAWYYFLDMIPAYPENWEDSLITGPPQYKQTYLFVGPKLVYFGYIDSISVTYSHWTQHMVPNRCAVDVGFQILPHQDEAPNRGEKDATEWAKNQFGWSSDWLEAGQAGPQPREQQELGPVRGEDWAD